MAAHSRWAAAVGSLSRQVIPALLQFLFPSCYEADRKYHPEEHYMRGPGPKWRAKHFANGASSREERSFDPKPEGKSRKVDLLVAELDDQAKR